MSTSDSYIIQDAFPESSNDQDEVDSLPSSIDSSELNSEESSDAQREWEASLQQLELILTMMIVPYAGKYFGRRFAYWSESETIFVLIKSIFTDIFSL
jgi:Mitochondrial import 2